MPKVLPSQIVAALNALLPNPVADAFAFDRDSGLEKVAPLFALYRKLPEEHFVLLTPQEGLELGLVDGEIDQAIIRRQNTAENVAKAFGTHRLPMKRVKAFADLLAECPDEAMTTPAKTLAFLPTSHLAFGVSLLADISTAHSALTNGEFKAACVMAGSVIETLLLWALKRKCPAEREAARVAWASDPKAKTTAGKTLPADWNDWKLYVLVETARRIAPDPILSPTAADAAMVAKDFRNLIHPERADKTRPDLGHAHFTVGAMRLVIEELDRLVPAGKL